MNRQIRQLEDDIISTLNGSDIPIEAKRLILADVLNLVTKQADKEISLEIRNDYQTIVENGDIENAEST